MLLNLQVENYGDLDLTPDFWDCECIDDYIHPKTKRLCDRCGAVADEQPDSRVNEVAYFLSLRGVQINPIPLVL